MLGNDFVNATLLGVIRLRIISCFENPEDESLVNLAEYRVTSLGFAPPLYLFFIRGITYG